MTRRRSSSLLEDLVELPWWVSVLVAGIVYVGLRWLLPVLISDNFILNAMASGFQVNVGLIAGLFLLPAIAAIVRQFRRGRLLDAQKDLGSLRALSWQEFEGLVGEAYLRRGYLLVERGGNAPDGGIDLVLHKGTERVVVQCKHWRARQVGVSVVRELYGVLAAEGATAAIVVTSGRFTPDAVRFAAGREIELVDGPQLLELIAEVQANPVVPDRRRQSAPAATTTPTVPSDPEVADAPNCPRCGSVMSQRVARQGARAGQPFWGCPRFPECRGTRPA